MKKSTWLATALWGLVVIATHSVTAHSPLPAAAGRAELILAPAGDEAVAPLIVREMTRAKKDGRDLVVYVGAKWCEPCRRFHKAVEAGEIDKTFPTLRLLEFDRDRDGERLAVAGYASRYIPLFAIPGRDGKATEHLIQGSVKGPGALENIVPRLKKLIELSRSPSP